MSAVYNIPPRVISALKRYAEQKLPPGGFLRAVLENNLSESLLRADNELLLRLSDIVLYIQNEMPDTCHGSLEKVNVWLDSRVDVAEQT